MSSHVFHEIYLHINWHTKDDVPLLIPRIEIAVHKLLTDLEQTRAIETARVATRLWSGQLWQAAIALGVGLYRQSKGASCEGYCQAEIGNDGV